MAIGKRVESLTAYVSWEFALCFVGDGFVECQIKTTPLHVLADELQRGGFARASIGDDLEGLTCHRHVKGVDLLIGGRRRGYLIHGQI